uniref:Uncharacterized protein n=1 Tax=Lactuca sativa TaxID=4236 RepID=A0A9R1WNC7_LACSA|nr:hypothetical protein LSAT_V11C100011010 [Lactuca sativa]
MSMNWAQRKIFLYNVTFGLYMLDPWERYLFNALVIVLMWFIFYNGYRNLNELCKRLGSKDQRSWKTVKANAFVAKISPMAFYFPIVNENTESVERLSLINLYKKNWLPKKQRDGGEGRDGKGKGKVWKRKVRVGVDVGSSDFLLNKKLINISKCNRII